MTPRRQRMLSIALVLAGVALAVGLALQAFQENLLFFYSPTQVLAGEPPRGPQVPPWRARHGRQRGTRTRRA